MLQVNRPTHARNGLIVLAIAALGVLGAHPSLTFTEVDYPFQSSATTQATDYPFALTTGTPTSTPSPSPTPSPTPTSTTGGFLLQTNGGQILQTNGGGILINQ